MRKKELLNQIKDLQTENAQLTQELQEMRALAKKQDANIQAALRKESDTTIAILENYEAAYELATAIVEIYEKVEGAIK